MGLRDEPHFHISAPDLATWLERQGKYRWWTVDGDPLLTGRISFPCPADELADELRKLGGSLVVRDRSENATGKGEEITAEDLDRHVARLGDNIVVQKGEPPIWMKNRILDLGWKNRNGEWYLIEDEETSESSCRDAERAAEKQG